LDVKRKRKIPLRASANASENYENEKKDCRVKNKDPREVCPYAFQEDEATLVPYPKSGVTKKFSEGS
jgi:hypothetical protein